MRVLGIDPGSRYLGFGIVAQRARRVVHVTHGVLRLTGENSLPQRLRQISVELQRVLDSFNPDVMAVEGIFTHKNARSALILGHARGVALLLAAQAGLDVYEYAPARVKRAVGTSGSDSKDSVARMVRMQLALPQPIERADASDALAVALCHLHYACKATPTSAYTRRKGMPADFVAQLKPAVTFARRRE